MTQMKTVVYCRPERAWGEGGEALAIRAVRGNRYEFEVTDSWLVLRNVYEALRFLDATSGGDMAVVDTPNENDWCWIADLIAIPMSSVAWVDLSPLEPAS